MVFHSDIPAMKWSDLATARLNLSSLMCVQFSMSGSPPKKQQTLYIFWPALQVFWVHFIKLNFGFYCRGMHLDKNYNMQLKHTVWICKQRKIITKYRRLCISLTSPDVFIINYLWRQEWPHCGKDSKHSAPCNQNVQHLLHFANEIPAVLNAKCKIIIIVTAEYQSLHSLDSLSSAWR